MRFISRHLAPLSAGASLAALCVLAYAPAIVGFALAAAASAGWCFLLDQRPGA
jgi:hypothetical protein